MAVSPSAALGSAHSLFPLLMSVVALVITPAFAAAQISLRGVVLGL
jgi:hypothetical protein